MACATDPSGRIGTGCRPGTQTQFAWAKREFGAGDLGCFNPRSVAGGVPSLHADGRGYDAAFNANDPNGRAAGDRFFHFIIDHADELGLQETLWRGYLWSCRNRHLGIRGPGIQQGPHMNHVHTGIGYFAADHWHESWLTVGPTPSPGPAPVPPSVPTSEEEIMGYVKILNQSGVTLEHWRSLPAGAVIDGAKVLQLLDKGWCEMYWVEYQAALAGQWVRDGKITAPNVGVAVPAR